MSRHRKNGKGFLFGALLGGALAGLTALLFAPKAGKKLRKDLSDKCCHMTDRTRELMEGVCDQSCEIVEKAKEIARDAKDAASSFINDLRR